MLGKVDVRDRLVRLDQNLPKLKFDRLQVRLEGGEVLSREGSQQLIACGGF